MAEVLIRSTEDLVAAWRARIRELGITHQTVDAIAGWADGYCSKLMCGMKKPGGLSISLMNAALGLGFVAVVDEIQADRVRGQWEKRKRPLFDPTHSGTLLMDCVRGEHPSSERMGHERNLCDVGSPTEGTPPKAGS
ncbi:hypothetical protein B2M20_08570 [Nitrobacter vulgaris]|uniref:Uncharacterized protein n=1 Tax=Nitrobacter vulgaris TaxID=29421 RepID=A0A1V4HYI8_NITVU|nr:hypothetical protein B2M20_08570 [Nitrobacter vulgaris]